MQVCITRVFLEFQALKWKSTIWKMPLKKVSYCLSIWKSHMIWFLSFQFTQTYFRKIQLEIKQSLSHKLSHKLPVSVKSKVLSKEVVVSWMKQLIPLGVLFLVGILIVAHWDQKHILCELTYHVVSILKYMYIGVHRKKIY